MEFPCTSQCYSARDSGHCSMVMRQAASFHTAAAACAGAMQWERSLWLRGCNWSWQNAKGSLHLHPLAITYSEPSRLIFEQLPQKVGMVGRHQLHVSVCFWVSWLHLSLLGVPKLQYEIKQVKASIATWETGKVMHFYGSNTWTVGIPVGINNVPKPLGHWAARRVSTSFPST